MRLTSVMVALARTSCGVFERVIREEGVWFRSGWGKGELGRREMNAE